MSAEDKIKNEMIGMGTYNPAFDPSIKMLCIQERELSRTMKAWKKTAPIGADGKQGSPSTLNPLYEVIKGQRRAIADLRDSLGLTPKGLQKLKGKQATAEPEANENSLSKKLDALAERCMGYG